MILVTAEKNITRQKEIALYKEREIERCQAELNEIEVDMARRKGELEVKTYEGMGTDLL